MIYSLKYELDTQRLIMAVVNDSRSVIPSLGPTADGNAVYRYSQSLISQMVRGVILYRIQTVNGNLGGVVAINTNSGAVGVVFQQMRPAFVEFALEINEFIGNFISNRGYLADILY